MKAGSCFGPGIQIRPTPKLITFFPCMSVSAEITLRIFFLGSNQSFLPVGTAHGLIISKGYAIRGEGQPTYPKIQLSLGKMTNIEYIQNK
jgi:hypothetical protein